MRTPGSKNVKEYSVFSIQYSDAECRKPSAPISNTCSPVAAAGPAAPPYRQALAAWLLFVCAVGAIPTHPQALSGSPLPPVAAATNDAAATSVNAPLSWQPTMRAALLEAEASDKPVLIFFHSSGCGWCARLRIELESPDVRPVVEGFARAELDVDRDRALALRLQVESVPTLVIAGPDGREIRRIKGFMPAAQLRSALARALSPATAGAPPPDLAKRLDALDQGRPATNDWPALLAAMGETAVRAAVRRYAAAHGVEIRAPLVEALRHPELAVRLGALDLLEELAGETCGFDPWVEPDAAANATAWQRWKTWQVATNAGDVVLFASLTSDRVEALLNDLAGTDRDRAARAVRALTQAGASCCAALEAFAASHPGLEEGTRKRLDEVRLATRMPVLPGIDGPALAHHLVFGTPDTRAKALAQLGRAGRPAAPVVRRFLDDPDALIREAAVEATVQTGGSDVAETLTAQTARERNGDVLHALLTALAHDPGQAGGAVLCDFAHHADEMLAIAALSGIPHVTDREAAEKALRTALDDPRWRVRVAALEAAAKMKPAALADRLETLTRDGDPFVRLNAVKALAVTKRQAAITTLEKLFLEQDELKATVVGLIVELEKPFPASFGPALRDKPADLLLGVLAAIEEHAKAQHMPLVLLFAAHADRDVSCTALRLVARTGSGTTAGQAALLHAVQSGDVDRQLAVLENVALHVPAAHRTAPPTVAPIITPAAPVPPAASTSAVPPAVRAEVDALFDAFDVAAAPLPASPSSPSTLHPPPSTALPPRRQQPHPMTSSAPSLPRLLLRAPPPPLRRPRRTPRQACPLLPRLPAPRPT